MAEARKRRREDPEARRAQILDAARRTFGASGFQGTTVDRIASEAGVSVGLLYRFFPSKSAIVRAIMVEDVQAPLHQIAGVLKKASTQPEILPHLIAEQVLATPLERERLALHLEMAAEVCRDNDLRAFVRAKYLELEQTLAKETIEFPGGRKTAHDLVDQLNIAGAVASGLAMHAILYSDSPSFSADLVRRLMSVIFSPADDGI